MLKTEVEQFLNTYANEHPGFSVTASQSSTGMYKNGISLLFVYYRSDAVRIEIKPGTTQHGEYEALLQEQLVYQKDSANPYSTIGRISFFVDKENISRVLQRLLESQTPPTEEQMALFAAYSQQYKKGLMQRQANSGQSITVRLVSQNRGCDARGVFNGQGVMVLAGSRASLIENPASLRDSQIQQRRQYIDQTGIVTEDVYFKSPSGAGDFVMGKATNGWEEWLTDEGVQLAAYREGKRAPANTAINQLPFHAVQIAQTENADIIPEQGGPEQKVIVVKPVEDHSRIERKLDSLMGVIATMYSEKSTPKEVELPKTEEVDKRFRLETTQGKAPVLLLKTKPAITGLIFTLKLCAVGLEGSAVKYRIFFASEKGEVLSEPQMLEVVSGGEYNCKFELRSAASEEKNIYLAVQGKDAAQDEARQLIAFDVKIAFSADFDL